MWANRRIVNRSINADHDKNREFETAYGQRGMVVCASIVNWSIAQKFIGISCCGCGCAARSYPLCKKKSIREVYEFCVVPVDRSQKLLHVLGSEERYSVVHSENGQESQ